jgi:hypothetical protein
MDGCSIQFGVDGGNISAMGQVIAFPGKREKKVVTDDRRAAVITGLCALTFLMGFFIAGPMLALFAFSYTSTAHPLQALFCVAGLLVVWPITRFAYKRL